MQRNLVRLAFAAVFAVAANAGAEARVPETQAKRLGKDLTPVGAEAGGSADETISHFVDRFMVFDASKDEPFFFITHDNADRYAGRLTATHRAMLSRYRSTYRMPVYPTRRTCRHSKQRSEASIANATQSELTVGGNGVSGASTGIPFPIPNNAYEMIWNHLLAYRGTSVERQLAMFAPNDNGRQTLSIYSEYVLYPRASDDKTEAIEKLQSYYRLYRALFRAPARYAGLDHMEYASIEPNATPSRQWEYVPGTRRIRRAPHAAYGESLPFAGGIVSYDSRLGFSGSPDRYEWSVIGRGTYYLPNNNNALASTSHTYADIVSDHHMTSRFTRYELQRVWIIEARLKEGNEHRFHRRHFYLQEDSWQILAADLYDSDGELAGGQELFAFTRLHPEVCDIAAELTYRFTDGSFAARHLGNREPEPSYDRHHSSDLLCNLIPASMRSIHGCGHR